MKRLIPNVDPRTEQSLHAHDPFAAEEPVATVPVSISGRCLPAIMAIQMLLIGAVPGSADEPRAAWTTSRIKGTPTPPPAYAIQPAFPELKFEKPTSLEELPGNRMLISEIGGKVFTFVKNRTTQQAELMVSIEDCKLWHVTVHPRFARNGRLFACYSKDGTTYVSEFQIEGSPPRAKTGSEHRLLTWPAGGHNAGCLQFGTDGMLYISTGDGSGPNPPDGRTAAQDVSNVFGCILRIDVDMANDAQEYAVPNTNPFVDLPDARPEIWAYGLRNPWKFGIDRRSGRIYAADNGWETWEMVHEIVRGGNCGWPIMEGRAILRSEVKPGPTPIRPPIKDHSHTEANSVIGGPVYRGMRLPELHGQFIYGDYITGTIWALRPTDEGQFVHSTLLDTDQRITAFAEGRAGELFVLDFDYTGQVYEVVPSRVEDRSASFPRRLSETGLFTSLAPLKPAPGVVPYEVVVERWTDGLEASRWIALPENGQVTLADQSGPASYPEGTVLVKHLSMPDQDSARQNVPVETQLLHYESGTWSAYSYLWNVKDRSGQVSDAMLVDSAGTEHRIVIPSKETRKAAERNWHVSAVNECRLCHNAGSGFILGFNATQLERTVQRTGITGPVQQLEQLAAEQIISSVPHFPANRVDRLIDPFDQSASLDDRARSYLHGNCSSCHHPKGNAIVSFFLRRELPFDQLNTNKGTGIGTFGIRNAKLIAPGDPYRSILLYRMSKLGYGRMPYIGSRAVDSRGVSLIEAWIRSLPHKDSADDSALVQVRSSDSQAFDHLLKNNNRNLPNDAPRLKQLIGTTEGALAIALGIHRKELPRSSAKSIYESRPGDVAGLFADFVPEDQRRMTLGRNADPSSILELAGDANRGRLIFSSDGARCRLCHHSTDADQSTGPTLAEIHRKYPRRNELLQQILRPSLKVDDKFAAWIAVTTSGQVHTGLLVSESDKEIVLKDAQRKLIRIARKDLDELARSPRSLMPEGILSDLTAQEAADLLAWLTAFRP